MLSDDELKRCESWGGLLYTSVFRYVWSMELRRDLTLEEVYDGLARLTEQYYQRHPEERPKPGERIGDITRNPDVSFWSRPI